MESIYKNGEDSYKEIIWKVQLKMQLQYKALDKCFHEMKMLKQTHNE